MISQKEGRRKKVAEGGVSKSAQIFAEDLAEEHYYKEMIEKVVLVGSKC